VTTYADAGGTNWTAHIFKTVGTYTFTVTSAGNVEYLVVAGGGNGGGGAYSAGGGGGAGGYQSNVGQTGLPVTMQTYTVVVANAAQDSKFYGTDVNLISKAGGTGGTGIDSGYPDARQVGGSGGSGGGGGGQGGVGGVTNVSGQGNNGGRGISGGSYNYGGGGGGASQVGGPGVSNVTGGPGGNGITNDITGIATNYCGGGSGGPWGSGGIGGGGAGSTGTGNPGGANTGGGGGGGASGGDGGSGIVVVRYVAASASPLITVSDLSHDFNSVLLNATGTWSYTIVGLALTNNITVSAPSPFTIATNGGTYGAQVVLTTNASGAVGATTINVHFVPTAVQGYAGTITNASAGASNELVTVSGTGAVQQIGVQQPAGSALTDGGSPIDFATAGLVKTFVVTNSGTITLTLTGITKDGSNPGDFTVGTLPASLAVGASTTFTVTFNPAALGARSANLHILNGTVDASFDIALTGTGSAAPFLAFGGDTRLLWTNYVGTSSQTVYGVHQFTNTGSAVFTPLQNLKNVEYLIIGGGGAGGSPAGSDNGGQSGGGAGGYRTSVTGAPSGGGASAETPTNLTAGVAVSVVVGTGGVGTATSSGTSGGYSSFGSIRSEGGGGGGGNGGAGLTGGSGGGSGMAWGAGNGTANQGFGGGIGNGNGNGGGGGGAGGAGKSFGGWGSPGDGGRGLTNSITGTPVARGGGGGGGDYMNDDVNITGAVTAGGGSHHPNGGDPGTAGTGGGGGGAGHSTAKGGNGGSGIVIIRYAFPGPPKGTVIMMR